ncbi:MAG: PKD domain-containing protein [Bacteroidales bacterium]|nr:PKD domain-containing protein [Bacteroidales bacterium]
MKKIKILIGILIITLSYQFSFSQNALQGFVLSGTDLETIEINQTFTTENEIFPFDEDVSTIFGLALNANISLENDKSLVRVILVDKNYEEHLIYEAYSLLEPDLSFSVDKICEETSILNSVKPHSVRVEITDATITINSFTYASGMKSGTDVLMVKKEKKQAQNIKKIIEINKNLKAKGLSWVAGPTSVSEMTYAERKKLYGQSTFPLGFEYYVGGVIKTATSSSSRETSLMVDNWDWRERHGQNWITSVTDQGQCGSCWAFAATGATEALVNLYFNQHLNLDLSEQDVLSCSGAGSCGGGWPYGALDYITTTGVVDEGTFPYTATDQPCANKGTDPYELIKIGGRIPFPSSEYPRTDDDLKRMIIERGPISGGLDDWWHAMVLPGYQVVEEGDIFFYRDLNLNTYWKTVGAGDPLIGEIVWIFKNSWGTNWGDNGYVYVETNITNINWTHALLTPVQSLVQSYDVVCEDSDGDGYYWWGLGEKPATCSCPDEPDGDDSDPGLGPLDEYGYCTILVSPVADFSGDPTNVMEGQTVTFTDQSTNYPTSWLWSFPGGNPASSTLQNPDVTYPAIGTYDVSLTATNSAGSDDLTKTSYIDVTEFVVSYCTSAGSNVSKEWIQKVDLGTFSNNSGSDGGYGDHTSPSISFESGQSYNLTLTPGFSGKSRREFWRVWIDYNMDGDFTDTGEEVFAANGKKNTVSGSISIPSGLTGETRMRVSMKYNATPASCEHFSYGEVEDYTLLFSIPIPQPPVADFSGTPTTVSVGNSVQFTDLSLNSPISWIWTFTGGTPSSSTDQNPIVTYDTEGSYAVSLKATNNEGSDTKTIADYITVVTGGTYCSSQSNSNALDWIAQVDIATFSNPSGASLYSDFTGQVIGLAPGSSNNITLTPHFVGKAQREFWRIWIDYNGDGDFDDSGEQVFVANNKKSAVTGTISIPSDASGQTRMRITMKNGSSPSSCGTFSNGEVEDYTADFGSGSDGLVRGNDFDLNIYPNPASNVLNILVISSNETVSIKVYNSLGRIIDEFDVDGMNTQIDLSNYPNGLYYVGADNGKQNALKKFVKN